MNTFNYSHTKKAIIIGATSGIGKGLAETLADNGYKVGITGRRTALLEQLKANQPDSFFVKTIDVVDTSAAIKSVEELVEELGGLYLIVISSGVGNIIEDIDFEVEKRTIDTNVTGFTNIADWAFNYFNKQRFGHLVGISSVAGLRGNRYAPSYSASKSYQINYLESLRQKAAHLKLPVYVTDIRPGFVDTAMAQSEKIFWVAPVEKAAQQIFKAIQSKKKVAYITKRWRLMAIILKRIPKFVFDLM
ncbi:MAG: SDR family NAD(P)-dependent oxidoreductase [Prevotellaceae bacterium]|jgi:short-subunit dehydrogenase|nr:SDR family NAD(P)-dependent oxidoreductase [Prevotellaceae bacterium]